MSDAISTSGYIGATQLEIQVGGTRGGLRKSGIVKHKSDNVSETCKDTGNVDMEGLHDFIQAVSLSVMPDPL